VGFGTGQLIRRGGISMERLRARMSDRFALAGRHGAIERTVPGARKRTASMRAVHALVLGATLAGGARGFLFPGTSRDRRGRLDKG
jgi:hypothetical protein